MRHAALLALCLLLAGCNVSLGVASTPTDEVSRTTAPTDTSTPAATQTPQSPATLSATSTATDTPTTPPTATPTPMPPEYQVEVRGNGERLTANATAVWLRVLDLHGLSPTEVPAPVVVVDAIAAQTLTENELGGNIDRFARLIGVNEDLREPVTFTGSTGSVFPARYNDGDYAKVRLAVGPNSSGAAVEASLVHEFAHVVQVETGFGLSDDQRAEVEDAAAAGVLANVREGAAVYVADVYAERYLPEFDPAAERRAAYEAAEPSALKAGRGGYYFGYRHVAARVDSPRNLSTVYRTPPVTDEQLLHGLARGVEPPVPLSVRAGTGWQRRGTVGELLLRVALTENLTESRAAEAAAGWGNDTLLRYGDGYAWVVRMDDARNASDLEAALRDHVASLAAATDPIDRPADAAYRVVRVDEETLALVVGDRAFVESVGVSPDDGAVTVSVEAS